MASFISALEIRRWAEQIASRSTLPQVCRRLVHATDRSVSFVEFPAHESVQRPGFDGLVESKTGSSWVPAGRSIWELSVRKDIKGKADGDYDKRTKETSEVERLSTTYIALTARHWKQKRQWLEDQSKKAEWNEVRAYDSDDLEQWLEIAPTVAAWFSRLVGTRPEDVDDIESRWNAIAESATKQLKPQVFLVSRDKSVKQLGEWLGNQPSQLAIEFRSPSEVLDFVCASIAAMDDPGRTIVLARTIIVESTRAWKALRDSVTPSVLVVDPSVVLPPEEIGRAVAAGHHVLLAIDPYGWSQSGSAIELERASEYELSKALEDCDYKPVEAEQSARAAAGSLAILKRRLARYSTPLATSAPGIVPGGAIHACLLLGGWDGGNAADREALEKLSNDSYRDIEYAVQQLTTCRDPIFLHAAGRWRVISKDEAWARFGNLVPASLLTTFESLAVEILADDDPKFNLPSDERHLAQIKGHTAKYSGTLKKHVAETLALLGTIGGSLEASASANINASVDRIVANLLRKECTWHRWASLSSSLPMLAEASPESFLKAVGQDLSKDEPELVRLFEEEGDGFFGGCNHAGLLWALEGLAWSTELVTRVCHYLLSLDSKDPGGRWANRPKASLCEILSGWMPHTTATVEERIKLVDYLIGKDHNATWSLLIALLPQMHAVSTPTHRPYWRDWANSWTRGATNGEIRVFANSVAEKVIEQAETSPKRWHDIVKHVGQFPYQVLPNLVTGLKRLAESNPSDADRRLVSDELAEQINRHRHFDESDWSIPGELLDELERVLPSLKPKSSAVRHAWLFAEWPDRYYERTGGLKDRDKALDADRIEALREIVNVDGFEGIVNLAQQASSPSVVGRILAAAKGDEFLAGIVPEKLVVDDGDTSLNLANGFILGRFYRDKWPWADEAIKRCDTNDTKAWFLAILPFGPDAWERAEGYGKGVSDLYWDRCRGYGHNLELEAIETATRRLVARERIRSAIDVLGMALHDKKPVSTETLFLPLEKLLTLPSEKFKNQMGSMTSHDIGEIVEALQDRQDADCNRLLELEWHYLRLLRGPHGHPPKALQRKLANDPAFFVEVLSFCFKSQNENEEAREATDYKVYMAHQAYELLRHWEIVPGTKEDSSLDEEQLRSWCKEAQALASEAGRLEVCQSQIGQILAHSPGDDDGLWPCAATRHVMEEIATDRLASGFCCGVINSRGVVHRAQGGDQERELVKRYKGFAARIRFNSPFVANVLDSIAAHYENYARHWDETDKWEE